MGRGSWGLGEWWATYTSRMTPAKYISMRVKGFIEVSNVPVGVRDTEKIEDKGKREPEELVLIYSQILVT